MIAWDSLIRWNYGSASILEVAWTLVGIVGVAFTAGLLRECVGDLRALKGAPTYVEGGARHIVARQHIRNMAQRLAMLTAFVVIGVALMLTPPPSQHAGPSRAAAILAGVFLFVEFTIVGGSIQDRNDRASLFFRLRMRRSEEDFGPPYGKAVRSLAEEAAQKAEDSP